MQRFQTDAREMVCSASFSLIKDMARKVLNFIGLSVLLFSCLSQDKTQDSLIDVGWSIVEDSDRIALQDYYSHSNYVVISIPEEQPFYTADKIQSGDGKYFLGDI
ncbi:hypothetical protein, partial [uncultured Algoriphagus sp.]|uniref:hypothetical protein n=1 Tax=uncultured Algoriphagus sp. TaxID=417365 RepID=UPI002593C432